MKSCEYCGQPTMNDEICDGCEHIDIHPEVHQDDANFSWGLAMKDIEMEERVKTLEVEIEAIEHSIARAYFVVEREDLERTLYQKNKELKELISDWEDDQ